MGSIFKSRAQCGRIAEKQCYLEKKNRRQRDMLDTWRWFGEYEQMKHKKAKKTNNITYRFHWPWFRGLSPMKGQIWSYSKTIAYYNSLFVISTLAEDM